MCTELASKVSLKHEVISTKKKKKKKIDGKFLQKHNQSLPCLRVL